MDTNKLDKSDKMLLAAIDRLAVHFAYWTIIAMLYHFLA